MTNAQFSSISPQQAREKIQSGEARAIDVRMAFDYAGSRVPGSVNLPNMSIRARRMEVPEDKELIFISEDGELSARVCELALSLGFSRVSNLEGGFTAWTDAGLPVETISEGLTSRAPS
jgi:rhodanese-related sulfurtransferase